MRRFDRRGVRCYADSALRTLVFIATFGLVLSACGDPGTFTEVQSQVFNPSCSFSACHVGAAPAGEMLLQGDAYDQIVNVPSMQSPGKVRVKPMDPAGSYLMDKLQSMGVTGTEMPPGALLEDERLELVRSWIEAGALDD